MIVLEALADLFFPGACAACGQGYGDEGRRGLCDACREALVRETAVIRACPRCSRPLARAPDGGSASRVEHPCRVCRVTGPSWRRLVVLGPYAGVLERLIKAGKFAERLDMVGDLAGLLAARLSQGSPGPAASYDAVVAVPSDHRLGPELADELAARLGSVRADPLRRVAGARRQGGLARPERLKNAVQALTRVEARMPQSVLLVDDVVTTGATLEAAARLLQTAGAVTVDVAVLARAPWSRTIHTPASSS